MTKSVGTKTRARRRTAARSNPGAISAVGHLAHDLKNLLALINGYAELLAVRLGDHPAAQRHVAEIRRAGQQSAELVRGLLSLNGRPPAELRPLDLNALVRDHAAVLTRLVGDTGRVELRLARGLPPVHADAAGLQQALLNLVLNAKDALRRDGRITIRTTVRAIRGGRGNLAGRYVALTVADNGLGMDAATIGRLFEPFFSTKPAGTGTGLGLNQVYHAVRRGGGHITVRSSPRGGSTFELLLPAETRPGKRSRP